MKVGVAAAVLLAALTQGACEKTTFNAISTAPPGKTAELAGSKIRLSRGAALALECIHEDDTSDPETTAAPCGKTSTRSDSPQVARAFVAATDKLFPVGQNDRATPTLVRRSFFVVIGVDVGRTQVFVDTEKADATFEVEVIP